MFFVYILARERRGRTYIGQTNDLAKRTQRHVSGHGAWYPKRYGLDRVVYAEGCATRGAAMARERELKALYNGGHRRLYRIIEGLNPHWLALDARHLMATLMPDADMPPANDNEGGEDRDGPA